MLSSEMLVVSRRQLMVAGLLLGIGAPLTTRAAPSGSLVTGALITKAIPSTGERLPVIGLGASRFGETDRSVGRVMLNRMQELGSSVIDTAARYEGSEESIGSLLQDLKLRTTMFISTKINAAGVRDQGIPTTVEYASDLSGIDAFERSLQRLQTDKVDLLMSHWMPSAEPLMPLLLDLKNAGRVRYIGISSYLPELQPRLASLMRRFPLDFVQVDYRLNDRSAEREILPLALERKIAVIAAVPFGGRRDLLFKQLANRRLPGWAEEFDASTWGQFFLKYVVSHPAVTCAIPGTSDLEHLEDNLAAARGRLPDAAMRMRIEDFWADTRA